MCALLLIFIIYIDYPCDFCAKQFKSKNCQPAHEQIHIRLANWSDYMPLIAVETIILVIIVENVKDSKYTSQCMNKYTASTL